MGNWVCCNCEQIEQIKWQNFRVPPRSGWDLLSSGKSKISNKILSSWISWLVKMGLLGCPTAPITNYHYTLRSILDKRRSQRGRNLQYWFFTLILGLCNLNKFNFIIFITTYYLRYIIALRLVRSLWILADEPYCTQNLVNSLFTNILCYEPIGWWLPGEPLPPV